MGKRQFWLTLVLIIGTAVLALFFSHLSWGSFSATHGPVSALRAFQFLQILFFCITAVTESLLAHIAARSLATAAWLGSSSYEGLGSFCTSILRC